MPDLAMLEDEALVRQSAQRKEQLDLEYDTMMRVRACASRARA